MPTQYDPPIDAGAREKPAVARRGLSRRDALRLGAAGVGAGAATVLAGCGGGKPGMVPTVGPDEMKTDSATMAALLELERTAVIAYEVAQAKLLGSARAAAARLRTQELAHERAIEQGLRSLAAGVAPARPRSRYAVGFPTIRTAQDALRFVLDIENTQVSAYGDAVGTLLTPQLRETVASILAVEAEHMSVILGELHQPQASQSLVTGNAPT
jgi:Ferritin-like domain